MKKKLRRIVDILLSVFLVLQLSIQFVGSAAHEWIGVTMLLTILVHNWLHLKWYGSLLKGKYNPTRALFLLVNLGVLALFFLTAVSGTAMSNHAVPFLHGIIPTMTARKLHLAMSHWTMIAMGLHIGLNWSMMLQAIGLSSGDSKAGAAVKKGPTKVRVFIGFLVFALATYGLFAFLRDGIPPYLAMQAHFIAFDQNKSAFLVFFDAFAMIAAWVYVAYHVSTIIAKTTLANVRQKCCVLLIAFFVIGVGAGLAFSDQDAKPGPNWGAGAQQNQWAK